MKIHIIGAGPSGMSLAWEFLRAGNNDITIYDEKYLPVDHGGNRMWKVGTFTHIELYSMKRLSIRNLYFQR